MDEIIFNGDIFVGVSGLQLQQERFEFPLGVVLEGTFAHVMSPVTVAFSPPIEAGHHHPGPWKASRGGFAQDVTAQVHIPHSAAAGLGPKLEIANAVGFLLKLWSDPGITMPVISNLSFSEIRSAPDSHAHIIPFEHRRRSFELRLLDDAGTVESVTWVVSHFDTTLRLMKECPEFRLAATALHVGQFVENTALTLISLWGALEALFSPSTSELKFRVSALISAYLYPPGATRMEQQKRIASLYDKRSAAAHGKPKHAAEDLVATFTILREVLIKFIEEGHVPTKQECEERLFGCRD